MTNRVAVLVTFSTKADSQLALPDCEELNGVEQFCKNCETKLHSSEPDVIQDMLSSLHRSKLLTTCNPCIPFRLFKATLQRIATNLRAGCANAHTAH